MHANWYGRTSTLSKFYLFILSDLERFFFASKDRNERKEEKSDVKSDSIFCKLVVGKRLKREHLTSLLFKAVRVYWPRLHVYVVVFHFYLLFGWKLEFRRDIHQDEKQDNVEKLPSILSFHVTRWNDRNILYFE